MKYVFYALTYQKYGLVRLQRVGGGLSFVSHQKRVFLRVCLNKLLSAILQEKHVLVCVPENCAVFNDSAREKGFLLVCGESRRVLLDFNKSNVSARLLLSYAVLSIIFLRATIFSVL